MAQKSSGTRHGTRRKLATDGGNRGEIAGRLRRFEEGDRVRIDVDPRVQDGMPHPRFHGRTCEVVESDGASCVVALTDGGKQKEFAVRPVHLSEA
ncbi:MAG: 50S ribosomal protein L21e [Candidatus Nanohaloarchaea archaeon]|nr:50S ribosomal protein L21e [Candidatus Nanohaloarchaea archaeon]